MSGDKAYWADAVSRAWGKTCELVFGSISSVGVAILVFIIAAFVVHQMRGADASKDWIIDGIVAAIATVCVGVFIFCFQLFILIPQQDHKTALDAESSSASLKTENDGLKKELANKSHELENATNKLDTVSLVSGAAPTGGLNERLDRFLGDFEIMKQTVGDLKKAAKNPLEEPIVSATATATIDFLTDHPQAPGNNIGQGGVVMFATANKALLSAGTSNNTSLEAIAGHGRLRIIGNCSVDDPYMGKPVKNLLDAQYIAVYYVKELLPVGTRVVSGQIVWVINNRITLKFEIPGQTSGPVTNNEKLTAIGIEKINDGLTPLKALSN